MRVALFTDTYSPQMNGVARTLQRMATALAERNHDVRVYTTSHPGMEPSGAIRRAPSIPFWAYEELRLSPPFIPGLHAELRSWRPALVHAATPFGIGLAGRAAARSMGVPLVTSYHTQLASYARFYGLGGIAHAGMRYLRWFHNSGARTYVPTLAIMQELAKSGFNRLSLWTRGVDAARFHPGYRSPGLREAMGARDESLIVAYVGRVAAEKGVITAARAMHEVRRHLPEAVFAVAGDGPALKALRADSPAGSYFPGRLSGDALSAFYASADVFVFPSETDTFGNVLLEAMASGLAVIAADVPTSREVLGDAGCFVVPGDARALAAAILGLASHRGQLDTMRVKALQRARRQTWASVWDRLIRDYEFLAGSRVPEVHGAIAAYREPKPLVREQAARIRHAATDSSAR